MSRIAGLFIYPIKSCAGVNLTRATLGRAGLESARVGDREWMIVDSAGRFLTQRQLPRMALIAPLPEAGGITLNAPGMTPLHVPARDFSLEPADTRVTVWNHSCDAFDEGRASAQWCSMFLEREVRLVRFDPAHKRVSNRERTGNIEALNRFSDGYPLLTISQASLDLLNARLQEIGREPLPMNRFRPNLVIDEVEAHDEDRILEFRHPLATFKAVKPCPRCPIPSIDQATGERGDDPLDVLSRYRSDDDGAVVFGENLIATRGFGATLSVGEMMEDEWNF